MRSVVQIHPDPPVFPEDAEYGVGKISFGGHVFVHTFPCNELFRLVFDALRNDWQKLELNLIISCDTLTQDFCGMQKQGAEIFFCS